MRLPQKSPGDAVVATAMGALARHLRWQPSLPSYCTSMPATLESAPLSERHVTGRGGLCHKIWRHPRRPHLTSRTACSTAGAAPALKHAWLIFFLGSSSQAYRTAIEAFGFPDSRMAGGRGCLQGSRQRPKAQPLSGGRARRPCYWATAMSVHGPHPPYLLGRKLGLKVGAWDGQIAAVPGWSMNHSVSSA